MWENYSKFREENDMDDILDTFDFPEQEEVLKYYMKGYFGVDKIGRPLYVDRSGLIKVDKLMQVSTEERVLRSYMQSYEEMIKHKFMACSALYDR